MKNRVLVILLSCGILLPSCMMKRQSVAWGNLPNTSKYGTLETRGALLFNPRFSNGIGKGLIGELLAVDLETGELVVQDKLGYIVLLKPEQIRDMQLFTHRPSVTTAKLSLIATPLYFTHGWFVFLTAPINWLSGASLLKMEQRAYKMPVRELSTDQLRASSRFPMGVPENYSPVIR